MSEQPQVHGSEQPQVHGSEQLQARGGRGLLGALVIYSVMALLAHRGLVGFFRLEGLLLARLDALLLAGLPAVFLLTVFRRPRRGQALGRGEGALWMLWSALSFFAILSIRPPAFTEGAWPLPRDGRSPRVLVHAFENRSGDPAVDWVAWGAATALAEGLDLVPGIEARLAPNMVAPEEGPAPWKGMQVGQATERLLGTVERSRERLVLRARLVDMEDGDELGSVELDCPDDDVLVACEDMTRRLAVLLGRGRGAASLPGLSRPLDHRESFRAYAMGVLALSRGRNDRAALRFQEALALDEENRPAFARLLRLAPRILSVEGDGRVLQRSFVELFNGGRHPMASWTHDFGPGLDALRSLDGMLLTLDEQAGGKKRLRLRPPLEAGERILLALSRDLGQRCIDPGRGRHLRIDLRPQPLGETAGTGREYAPVGATHPRPFAALLRLPPGAVVLACRPVPDSAFRHAGRLHLGWSRFLPEGLSLPLELWFETDAARAQEVVMRSRWMGDHPWPEAPREAWLDGLFARARIAFLLGEHPLARREAQRILDATREPARLFHAHALLGRSFAAQGRPEALAHLRGAWALFPESFDARWGDLGKTEPGPWSAGDDAISLQHRAEALHRSGRDDEATAVLRASLARWPENPWCHRMLAERAVSWGAPDRVNLVAAVLHGERALQPSPAWVLAEWAEVELARGRLKEAFDFDLEALRLASPPLERLLARALDTASRLHPLDPPLGTVLSCRPPDERPRHRLTVEALVVTQLSSRRLQAAEGLLRGALLRWPAAASLHELLGRVAALAERWDEAIIAFETALALNPQRERPLFWLASVQARVGRVSDARDSIASYLKRSTGKKDEELWRRRARELETRL